MRHFDGWRQFPGLIRRRGSEGDNSRMSTRQIQMFPRINHGNKTAIQSAERFEEGQPIEKRVSAKNNVVGAQPGFRHPEEPQVVRERTAIKVEMGKRISQRNFVAQTDEFQTAEQLMSRQVPSLDGIPDKRTAVGIDVEDTAAYPSRGWRKHDHASLLPLNDSVHNGAEQVLKAVESWSMSFCVRTYWTGGRPKLKYTDSPACGLT